MFNLLPATSRGADQRLSAGLACLSLYARPCGRGAAQPRGPGAAGCAAARAAGRKVGPP